MIGRSYPDIPVHLSSKMCAIWRNRNLVTPIVESVRLWTRIRPYPTGRLFWVAMSEALRARLRSHRCSGTKYILRAEALNEVALMGLEPLAEYVQPLPGKARPILNPPKEHKHLRKGQ
jgi:hypothetical protein